jgi:NAD+ kinase
LPGRVAVIAHRGRPGLSRSLQTIQAALSRRKIEVELYDAEEPLSFVGRKAKTRPGFVISLGGDGTILAAARSVTGTTIPVLPINYGGLGFLATAESSELTTALRATLDGKCETEIHRTLRVDLRRSSGHEEGLGIAVNDAVLRQGESMRALRADLELDGRSLGTLLADGLIVATPIGSSAYSLSAGGPLLIGGVPALVATPVCPHTLQSRPLVFSGKSVLTARVFTRGARPTVSLDGHPGIEISAGDEVRFALARETVRFLRLPKRDSVEALRQKLNWHGTELERSP